MAAVVPKAVPDCKIHIVCGEYQPYRGGTNPKFNAVSGMILDLKEPSNLKHDAAVAHFGSAIAAKLGTLCSATEPLVLALVPSHKKGEISKGMIAALRKHVVPAFTLAHRTLALRRHTAAPKRAHGGDRSVEIVLNTVEVVPGTVSKGCTVVLLDDITSTGNSFKACNYLLRQAGAHRVVCISLLKTA